MRRSESPGRRPLPAMLLGGMAPLVFAAVLVVLLVLFAPSIAPERYVPVETGTNTTTTVAP